MELKLLIESAIQDLNNNVPIESIMLKAQTIAYYLKDDNFMRWVKCEQRGYGENDTLPDYRKVACAVKINIQRGFQRIDNFEYPTDLIEEPFSDRLSHIAFFDPISDIERMGMSDSVLSMQIPAHVFPYINKCVVGNIDGAYQYTTPTKALSIVGIVKSRLLDFFLKLEEEANMGIDFNKVDSNNNLSNIMNQTIYAGVVNTGSGNVNANNSTIVGGENNNVGIDYSVKKEIQSIIEQIQSIRFDLDADEQDAASYIYEIQQELKRKVTMPGLKENVESSERYRENSGERNNRYRN